MLTASGQTTSGSTIDSDPITVDVERPDMPVSVNALMSSVTLDAPGESFPIKLFAVFGDGSALDVTNSSYVSYSSNSPNLFSVDASGDVTALAPGYGWVVASYTLNSQTVQAIIPITVSTGPLYGVDEQLPFWIAAPSLKWVVSSGQIVLNPTGGAFVRQVEDDLLTSFQALLVNTNDANRISNDSYFRNASPGANPVIVTADSNGVAQITAQLALNPPELRPHFPYSGSAPGNQVPTAADRTS